MTMWSSLRSRLGRLLRPAPPAPAAQATDASAAAAPASPLPPPAEPPVRFADATAAVGLTIDTWVRQRRATQALYVGSSPAAIEAVRQQLPARVTSTLAAAERAMRHEFSFLGSGPFVPVDAKRPARNGYTPIDWFVDPVRGLAFRRGVPHKEWKLYEMRPGNADIKYPWEQARCQHFGALGEAFVLTGDSRFALEILRQIEDFAEVNPPGSGINWTCTMDVGLRAANWAIGLDLVRTAAVDDDLWLRVYEALFDHGVFIRGNLENTYEVTSNHFLSNVVGLWFLGAVFADLAEGQQWLTFARESLEREINVQVLPDGADFESSVPYHRLVAELFLGCARLADTCGAPLSAHYRERVGDMVAYLAGVLRPDGLMPQLGDADDGRLHILAESTTPQDPRHLFGPAGAMFGNADWLALGGDTGAWEAAWWGCEAPVAQAAVAPPTHARLYPQAGVAIVREQVGHYLMVTNAIVGTEGFGNHKHNDQLGFEYHIAGVPLVVDAGSYVYTSAPEERNRFRGTAYHNTLMVDGVEQNDMRPDWLFRMFETARAEHLGFESDETGAVYRGRHVGYSRLDAPVTHERIFRFDRQTAALTITDWLHGNGAHTLQWHFHFAAGVEARLDAGAVLLSAAGHQVVLQLPRGLEASLSSAWYSPSYGARVPCTALDLRTTHTLAGAGEWTFGFTAR